MADEMGDLGVRKPDRGRDFNHLFQSAYAEPSAVPEELSDFLLTNDHPSDGSTSDLERLYPVLSSPLTWENYGPRFQVLLHLEEAERNLLRDVTFQKLEKGRFFDQSSSTVFDSNFVLKTSHPTEHIRVRKGDNFKACSPKHRITGYVIAKCGQQVYVHVETGPADWPLFCSKNFTVYFTTLNRKFCVSQNAVKRSYSCLHTTLFPSFQLFEASLQIASENFEFPQEDKELLKKDILEIFRSEKNSEDEDATCSTDITGSLMHSWEREVRCILEERTLLFYNRNLDFRQRIAVENILRGESRPTPYVITGAPGTGKSLTIIEVVTQLILKSPRARILVTAPHNSAVDVLLQQLIQTAEAAEVWQKGAWVRMMDPSVSIETFPSSFHPFCTRHTESFFERLVFCTCKTAGLIAEQHRIVFDLFTHVIVDEAGTAPEPECFIPIALLHRAGDVQIVLAGDVFQLRPRIASPWATKYGLENSLLFRLLNRPPYLRSMANRRVDGYYDRRCTTALLCNYRSAPDILLPSVFSFYDGRLLSAPDSRLFAFMPDVVRRHSFLVITVPGEEKIIRGSLCNRREAAVVSLFVKKLLSAGVVANDIVILTPFSSQVEEIKSRLRTFKIPTPSVHRVEEFSGCERNIVVLSAVQTNFSAFLHSSEMSLQRAGLLDAPDRMNVSLSRARCQVCLVGNADCLSQDLFWKQLMKHAECLESFYTEASALKCGLI